MSVQFDPKEDNCFNVYWKIKNFSYCWEEITTSAFTVGGYPWCITLRPRDIECRLLVLDPNYKHQRMSFLVSFLPCDGSEPLHGRDGTCLQVSNDTIFRSRRNSFLPKDTLTVRFRYPTFFERGKLLVQSSIGVKMECFIWTLENFNKERRERKDMKKIIKESKLYGNIELNLKKMGGFNTDEQVYIEISRNGGEKCYCVLTVSVLDMDGEALNEVRDEFVFEKKNNQETRGCPAIIKKSKLLLCKNRLLPNDTLSLKCNLALSLGTVTDQTSIISYCKDISPLMKESDDLSMTFQEKNDSCKVTELQADLKSLLHDGTLSDMTFQVGTEVIQVHKNILSARSSVFKAMFKKEPIKNTVVIEDLSMETVRMLVLYLYTDTVPDYKWETIKNLYLAAEKYKVQSLKEKCSFLLVANFSISNLCEALVLANLSEDAYLKTAALNFLSANDLEVFESEEWKEFENCRPAMALKTLRGICVRRNAI